MADMRSILTFTVLTLGSMGFALPNATLLSCEPKTIKEHLQFILADKVDIEIPQKMNLFAGEKEQASLQEGKEVKNLIVSHSRIFEKETEEGHFANAYELLGFGDASFDPKKRTLTFKFTWSKNDGGIGVNDIHFILQTEALENPLGGDVSSTAAVLTVNDTKTKIMKYEYVCLRRQHVFKKP